MKRVLFIVLIVLAICLVPFASFNNTKNVYAMSSTIIDEKDIVDTYTYTDSTCEEYYGASANAIDKVVGANIEYTIEYTIEFTVNASCYFHFLTKDISGSPFVSYAPISYCINDVGLYSKIPTNMTLWMERIDGNSQQFLVTPNFQELGNGYRLMLIQLYGGGTYRLRITGVETVFDVQPGALIFNKTFDDGLSSLVDMSSLTDTNIFDIDGLKEVNTIQYPGDVYVGTNNSYYSTVPSTSYIMAFDHYKLRPDLFDFNEISLLLYESEDGNVSKAFSEWYDSLYPYGDGWLYNISPNLYLTFHNKITYSGQVCCLMKPDFGVNGERYVVNNISCDIVIKDFEVLIDMPTYRSQNSLLLYNYDYNSALSNLKGVTYRLYRDRCFYDIVYAGSFPNKKTLIIDNQNIQNMTFSNYIYVLFDFDTLPVNNSGEVNLGFDFNFGNYVEPFPQVVVNSSEATFDRPDLPTDLTPRLNFEKTDTVPWFKISLYFPVVKYIEYGFIWLLFYCPIIGDCTAFLYTFFRKFVGIFGMVIELPLGTFLLSFVAFFLCFKLFSAFLPFASDTINVTFKSINNNIRRKREDNKRFDDRIKKQKYKNVDNIKKKKRVSKKQFNDKNPNRI